MQERRSMDQQLQEEIAGLDTGVIRISKSILSLIVLVVLHFGYSVWWAAGIDAKFGDFESLQVGLSTALVVLGDHGTELLETRKEQAILRGRFADINKRIDTKTVDRFTRSDFREWRESHREHLKLRCQNLLEKIEQNKMAIEKLKVGVAVGVKRGK